MRVVPEKLQCPPVADPVDARRPGQAQGEQLRHVILSDFRESCLGLPGQLPDLHEVAVVASRPAARRLHDLGPGHGLEVLQFGQDFVPPDPDWNAVASPSSPLIQDAEPPHDRFAIMGRWGATRACARLLAGRRKCARGGPLSRSSDHGSYRLP